MKEFNSLEEIQKYYNEETNTYVFKENDKYIHMVVFTFDLRVKANIDAYNIKAKDICAKWIKAYNIEPYDVNHPNNTTIEAIDIKANNIFAGDIRVVDIDAYDIKANDIRTIDIKANDINAHNIEAWDIKAENISYFAVCFAYGDIICKSIKGRRENCKHFVLDGVLEIMEDKKSE